MTDESLAEERFIAEVRRLLVDVGASEYQISVQYENDLQDYGATIGATSSHFDDLQVTELAEIYASCQFNISFTDPALWRRVAKAQFEKNQAQSRAWLAERGLLDSVPQYDPSQRDLAAYARKLEIFSGLEPG